MLLTSFFSWWYGAGWRLHAGFVRRRLGRTSEFFSILDLLKTLFSPYRQISAGAVRGNLSVKWHAFLDRTVSRAVGFVIRTLLLIIGLLCLLGLSVVSLLWLVLWPLMPVLPLVALVLASTGVTLL